MYKYAKLLLWILVLQSIGYLIGLMTSNSINTWYLNLDRSLLTPPNYIFPIAWTTLYGLIAIAGWRLWELPSNNKVNVLKILFVTQMILNWLWSPVFFYFQQIDWALVILTGILLSTAVLIIKAYKIKKFIAYLLIPYLLWSLFAWYLNYYIYMYN